MRSINSLIYWHFKQIQQSTSKTIPFQISKGNVEHSQHIPQSKNQTIMARNTPLICISQHIPPSLDEQVHDTYGILVTVKYTWLTWVLIKINFLKEKKIVHSFSIPMIRLSETWELGYKLGFFVSLNVSYCPSILSITFTMQ